MSLEKLSGSISSAASWILRARPSLLGRSDRRATSSHGSTTCLGLPYDEKRPGVVEKGSMGRQSYGSSKQVVSG